MGRNLVSLQLDTLWLVVIHGRPACIRRETVADEWMGAIEGRCGGRNWEQGREGKLWLGYENKQTNKNNDLYRLQIHLWGHQRPVHVHIISALGKAPHSSVTLSYIQVNKIWISKHGKGGIVTWQPNDLPEQYHQFTSKTGRGGVLDLSLFALSQLYLRAT